MAKQVGFSNENELSLLYSLLQQSPTQKCNYNVTMGALTSEKRAPEKRKRATKKLISRDFN